VQEGDHWTQLDANGIALGNWIWDEEEGMWVFEQRSILSRIRSLLFVENLLLTLSIIGAVIIAGGLVTLFIVMHKKENKKIFSKS